MCELGHVLVQVYTHEHNISAYLLLYHHKSIPEFLADDRNHGVVIHRWPTGHGSVGLLT